MPNYSIDPIPGVAVAGIQDLRLKCLAIVARATNRHPGDWQATIRIGGAGAMIDGLCYHFRRYIENRKPMGPMLNTAS